ncbi:polysaccharide deacetylase family protein [Microtetraspora sp. AC03309]|uniref:polysaccharide deacetylase family protein n=1 Tax=Microtetraspora sp. AC03309 TaxID=2779376 RepID=UPI001E5210CC|nr:polysaccharide deacetylase family protein [Microtetraspora sp. AC03309]MCC5581597.1 polysaccharide deacetylase family protein [Microtetraspora sp. AC03309]
MALHRFVPLAAICALALSASLTSPAQAHQQRAAEPYCVTHKCIALTFDDGPAEYTNALLKVLKKYKAKATFFLIGNRVKKHPKLTKNIATGGHELGNHTWDHKYLTDLEYKAIYDEVKKTQDIIKKTTGKTPVLFRAPGGLTNDGVRTITAKFKLLQIPGTVSTQDYIKDYRDVEFLTGRALDIADQDEVMLMHETVKQTVESLPAVLEDLTSQGYSFVTVSKLLEGQELIPGEIYPEQLPLSGD